LLAVCRLQNTHFLADRSTPGLAPTAPAAAPLFDHLNRRCARSFEHTAASIDDRVLLLTLLDGRTSRIHGRAVCGSSGTRGGTGVGGSANDRGGRDRMMVIVPASVCLHVDVLVDVDAVAAAAADVGRTGIGSATATGTSSAATTTAGRSRRATATTGTAASSTRTPAAATTGSLSHSGDDEAGQHERGQRGKKQLAE
jgi:hypothetical protein